jgi:hypothetical protein
LWGGNGFREARRLSQKRGEYAQPSVREFRTHIIEELPNRDDWIEHISEAGTDPGYGNSLSSTVRLSSSDKYIRITWLSQARTRAVPIAFSIIAHEPRVRTSVSTIRFIAESWSLTRETAGYSGLFGIDKPTVYERNACAGEKSELPTCCSRAECGGGGEAGIEIHTP